MDYLVNRKKLAKEIYNKLKERNREREFTNSFPSYDAFEEKVFKDEASIQKLRKLCKQINVSVGTIEWFYKNLCCDLSQFSSNRFCSSTPPAPVTGSTPSPDTSCPPAVSGDTSENSPNKKEDPGGGGKIYNISGDPYKWRIGEDGGWWAKRDSQSKWNNISGQVNRCEKPKWRISIDTMDRKYFNGDATRRVAAKNEVNESNNNTQNSFRLGKFFID